MGRAGGTENRPGCGVTAEARGEGLLRARPLIVCPGRLRLVLQSGLDECARGPGGDLRLFVWRESAQVLKDDQCLPSDDHCQGGYQALEADLVEAPAQRLDRGLDPVDPPIAALRFRRVVTQPGWEEFPSSPMLYQVITEAG